MLSNAQFTNYFELMLLTFVQVLMVDHKTGKPLPFGSLGIHKVCSVYSAMGNLQSERVTWILKQKVLIENRHKIPKLHCNQSSLKFYTFIF